MRLFSPADFGRYALGITVYSSSCSSPVRHGDGGDEVRLSAGEIGRDGFGAQEDCAGVGVAASFGVLLMLCLAFSSYLLDRALFRKAELTMVLSLLALGGPRAAVSTVVLSSMQALGQIRMIALIRIGLESVGKFLLAVSFGFGLAGS